MAGNYTIPVDVELRTKQQNVKNLRSAIENEFRDIDFNSSIGKQLNKLFNQFDTKISDMDSILGKGILDMGDLNKLNGIFNRMNLIVGQMRSSAHKAPLVDLGIDAQSVPELVEARKLVKQITSEMAKQKAVSTKDRLKQTGQQDLLDDLNKIQKTRAHENKPLGVNAKIIQEELNEAENLIKQHYEKRDQLDKQFQEKSAKAKQSQKILDDAEADYVKNAQKASLKQIMALETAAGKKGKKSTLESQFGGGNKLSQKSAQKFLDEFMVEAGMAFEGTQISGTLTQKLWEGMFTENEIAQMQQAGGDIGEALYAGLEQKLLDPTSRERFRQIVHDFSKNATGSAEGYANTADNIKKNLPNLMNQAKADAVEVQAIEQSQIDNANAIATLEPQIASFKAVVDRLAAAASTLETVIQNKYQKELNEANRAAEQAKANAIDQDKPILAGAQVGNEPIPQYQQQGIQAQEAEKFKTNLQQSIKQWMGVREVINYIKRGVRQAYQDIKGLDKAMTNIAVVTDFSVSDLWGKINEYMSIAQQYGVTTQGVYEVSQLYFQQGLGEADTMAATTETLKMARIAGMDYAEAADGMTVAIRGFNMEMQDAAHVTDVYSKVAAITASDTQELVTAMSKTASSAAAVGSSFENTTAMLAVMIEATRESPQNLGSALKSIISRYGEMTKGLSEDSEGEEIDYNRVDAALKTVGISLKDAQGQFRDFDTVIEELSAKWDTLDSVTQRYIATIFAGNRQQSRFLALVSNYDRYMEVSEAAADSEDAGLLQYSKTLDSLETKLNNIKTSFQQFYMSLIDGPTIGAALDFVNNLIKGFNKLSKFTTILNIAGIISGIKVLGNLFVNTFSSGFSNISAAWKATLQEMVIASKKAGAESKIAYNEGQNTVPDQAPNQQPNKPIITRGRALTAAGFSIGGAALSGWGSAVAQENQTHGAWLSGAGSGLSTIGLALSLGAGGWIAGLAGAIVALVSAISSIPTAFEEAQQKVEKQQEVVNQKNIERAQAKEDYKNLTDYYQKLQDLEKTRFDSTENQKEWLELNNQIVESYPQLIDYYDLEGNAIADLNAVQLAALESKDELIKKNKEYYESEIRLNELNKDKTLGEIGTSSIGKMSSAYAYTGGETMLGAYTASKQQYGQWESDQERFSSIISQGGFLGEFFKKQFETVGAQKITGQTLLDIINEQGYSLSDLTSSIQKNINANNLSNLSQDSTALDYFAFVLKELGLFNINDGEASASKTLLDLFDISQFDRTSETFAKGYASQIVSTELLDKEEIIVEELSGVEKLFSLRLENLYNAAKQAGELEEETTYTSWLAQDQSSQIQDALNEWNIWYGGLTNKQQELIHNLLNAPKTISIDELGELPQEGAPIEEIKDSWYSSIVPEYYRLIGALVGTKSDLGGEDLLDFKSFVESERINEYTEGTGSQEEAYYDYLQSWIREQIDGSKESLTNILLQGNIEDIDEYNKFIQEQDAIIEKTAEDTSANRAALEKKKFVTEKLNQILAARAGDKESPFFKIIEDTEAMGEFLSLLFSEDAGTFEWKKQFDKFKNKYDIQGLEDIDLVMYEHANTMFSNYQSNFEQYQDSIEKLYSSQTDGWSEVESISYAKKQGKDWTELFEAKNNKIVLKDFETALSDAQNVYIQPLKDFQSYGEKAVSVLKTLDGQGIVSDSELDENLQGIEGMQNFIDSYTQLSSKEIIANAKEWANLGDNEDLTWDQLISYLQENYAEIDTAFIEAMQKRIQEEAAQALRIAERTSELQGSLEDQNKQEAYSMLSSKGLTGYTEGEIAQLEEYLGVGKGGLGAVETGEGTGEYKIDQSKLADLPQWVQTAIWQIINDTTQSSLDEIAGLGAEASKIGGADKGVYVSAFEKYAKRFGAEWTENYIPSLIEGATAESYSDAAKYGSFTNRLKNLIKQENPEATDEEIEEKTKELINGYKDGLKEAEEEIINLKLDALEKGFISASDKETLKEVDINFAQSFDEAIAKTGIERAQAIYDLIEETLSQKVNSGSMTELEKIEELGKTSSKQFQALYQEELKNAYFEEAKTSIVEGDRILSFDELGKLQVASGKSLEDFYSKYIKGITKTGEAILNIPTMFADGIITDKQYAQFQRNFAEETFGSAEDLITRMASKDDVYVDEIESFFEAIGAPLQEGEAELLLKGGVQVFLSKIENTLLTAGVPQSDIDSRLAEIQAQLIDLLLESISSGISSLGSGLEGTLGAADYQNLAKKYGLTGVGTSKSSKGIRLGAADQQKLISRMFIDAQNAGMESDFGEQIWEVYRDNQEDAIDGYTAIIEEIDRVKGEHEKLTGEALAYVEALQQARHAAMFDEDSVEFAFMEQDSADGLTKSFDKFVDNIDKAKEAIGGLKTNKTMGYNDFFNILDTISESGKWKTVAENMGLAKEFVDDYNHFATSVVSASEEIGKIDAKGLAAVGLDVSTAAKGMAEGMADGLKETAKSQVEYLTGIEKMLLALQALEGIGNVDLSLGISFKSSVDGPVDLTLSNISKYWQEIMDFGDANLNAKIDISIDDKLRELGAVGFNDFFENLGFGENFDFITAFFGKDGFTFGSKTETQLASQFGQFASITKDLTEQQWLTLAQDMQSIFDGKILFDKLGNFAGFNFGEDGLESLVVEFQKFLSTYDFGNIKESLNTTLNRKFGEMGTEEITLKTSGLKLKLEDDGSFSFDGLLTDKNKESVMADLSEWLGQTVSDITVGKDGKVKVFGENGIIDTSGTEKLNTDFATAAEAASTLQTAITQISTVASTFQAGSGFQSLTDQLNAAAEAAGKLINAFGSNGETALPDTSAIEAELAAALAIYESMGRDMTHGVIPMNYDELDAAQDRVIELQGQLDALKTPSSIATGLIAELGSAVEIANQLSNALANNNGTPLEVNFNVDEANDNVTVLIANLLQLNAVFKPTIEIEDKASSVLEGIIQLIANIHSKTVTIATVHKDIYTSVSSSGNGGISDKGGKDNGGPGPFAGTMNGLAFADGSLGRLHSGATLANKALVGELGPELAVYDGQYHMLGANGAEFVDLPSDAIIFNHLQTQGILRGQMNIRGTAMAEGNVSGPAYASGIGAALSAVRRAKSVWQGLLNSLSASDLMGAGGGGGGGGGDESLKAHIADLQEWYNLSRQIADIEGQINVLLAKRKNLTDGREYLRNLRETQRLLDDQVNTQQDLLRFQELQLQRQAEHINTHDIWSQFLEVNENGLLQYIEGNETNGGKGALEVLQKMNEMSGAEQVAYVKSLGYTYEPPQGEDEEVDEEEREKEIVAKFYEELQKQIDDYDALRDTVQETEGTLADLEEQINEIEKEIRDNEIDLSKEIYDIIVDSWKENIENLKEQNDLIKEANEAYANGIQEAIDVERQMYDQNTAVSDREQLQRQLALMRRSGGSASEIADLEKQLNDMLKEEYFTNQEKQLETIQKANERQAELLDQQVKIQEDLLEYQQENGVIWNKVYEVLSGTDAEIMDFMQGNKTDFFEQSALQQEDMLTEWAKKIGIYTEERQRQNYAAEAVKTFGNVWNNETDRGLQDAYNRAGSAQQEKWKREYNDTYASKMLEGKSHEEALVFAQEEFYEHIRNWIKAEEDKKKQQQQWAESSSSEESGTSERNPNQRWKATGRYGNSQGDRTDVAYGRTKEEALGNLPHSKSFYNISYGAYQRYAKGGIIDYTGPAWVDGSKSKPERILSAEQNRILEEGLAMNAGRSDKLREMFSNFAENLGASVRASISNITNRTSDSTITIQPGAVQLNIEQLNDKYDVDELFNDVADRLYSIAARASGRSINRR